jgi:hypothetical protein
MKSHNNNRIIIIYGHFFVLLTGCNFGRKSVYEYDPNEF